MPRSPRLPQLLERKIYKTGQTRGATDDEIFQNRVGRNSTVLISYDFWEIASVPPPGERQFENGLIALITPNSYFDTPNINQEMQARGLTLGVNALVFYETRADWRAYNPEARGWQPAQSRRAPLGGKYVARVPATTATNEGDKINRGFTTTGAKGAGIRVYEYASTDAIQKCRLQLEALFWRCIDSTEVALEQGMSRADITTRQQYNRNLCEMEGLLDMYRLLNQRLVNANGRTSCPLCLEEVSASGFFTRVEQAEGRVVPDLTITQLNLFHVEELRLGRYGHRPYNLGWGHHHCNVVVKDAGIHPTLIWMYDVVRRNIDEGYLTPGE